MNEDIISTIRLDEFRAVLQNKIVQEILDHVPAGIQALYLVRDHENHIIDFTYFFANAKARDILGEKSDGKQLRKEFAGAGTDILFSRLLKVYETGKTESFPHHAPAPTLEWLDYTVLRFGDGVVITYPAIDPKNSALQ